MLGAVLAISLMSLAMTAPSCLPALVTICRKGSSMAPSSSSPTSYSLVLILWAYFPSAEFFGDNGVGFKQDPSASRHDSLFHGGFGRLNIFYFHFHILHFHLLAAPASWWPPSANQFGQSFCNFIYQLRSYVSCCLSAFRVHIRRHAPPPTSWCCLWWRWLFTAAGAVSALSTYTHLFGNNFAGYNGDILQHLFFLSPWPELRQRWMSS